MHFLERFFLFFLAHGGQALEAQFIGAAGAEYLPGSVAGAQAHDAAEFGVKIAQQEHLALVIQHVERKALHLGLLLHQFLAHGLQFPGLVFRIVIFVDEIEGENGDRRHGEKSCLERRLRDAQRTHPLIRAGQKHKGKIFFFLGPSGFIYRHSFLQKKAHTTGSRVSQNAFNCQDFNRFPSSLIENIPLLPSVMAFGVIRDTLL